MKDLEELRGACRMVDEHWIWAGAVRPDGRAHIWAPDYTRGGGRKTAQAGPRAVWHMKTEKPIPAGWRVYTTCEHKLCCNPACVKAAASAKVYAYVASTDVLKGNINRILANRATNRARCRVDAATVAEIQASAETGVALAARLGLSMQVVSKARRGGYVVHAAANPFAALMGG